MTASRLANVTQILAIVCAPAWNKHESSASSSTVVSKSAWLTLEPLACEQDRWC